MFREENKYLYYCFRRIACLLAASLVSSRDVFDSASAAISSSVLTK